MPSREHKARKRFGQNFLQDVGIISQIVACIAPQPEDKLVEIGPGLGALTQPLLARAGHVTAIELDRDLVQHLQTSLMQNSEPQNLTLHSADALKFDYRHLTDGETPLRIVGNLPYNITSPLLFHLLQFRDVIKDMHFMLQKEVVDRIVAQPGSRSFGRISVMMQYYCSTESLLDVPPTAFSPAPKVQSAVIRLKPRATAETVGVAFPWLERAVQRAFATRRKTLRNNFRDVLPVQALIDIGIDPAARAETLEVADFVRLANLLEDHSA